MVEEEGKVNGMILMMVQWMMMGIKLKGLFSFAEKEE